MDDIYCSTNLLCPAKSSLVLDVDTFESRPEHSSALCAIRRSEPVAAGRSDDPPQVYDGRRGAMRRGFGVGPAKRRESSPATPRRWTIKAAAMVPSTKIVLHAVQAKSESSSEIELVNMFGLCGFHS